MRTQEPVVAADEPPASDTIPIVVAEEGHAPGEESSCCSPTQQGSCCEPAAKATCCGPSTGGGCGCR